MRWLSSAAVIVSFAGSFAGSAPGSSGFAPAAESAAV